MPRGLRPLFQHSVEPLLSKVMLKRQRLAGMKTIGKAILGDIRDCAAEIAKAKEALARARKCSASRTKTEEKLQACEEEMAALGKELAEHQADMAALRRSIQPPNRSPAARALAELEAPLVSRGQDSTELDGSSSSGGGGSPSSAATASPSRAAPAHALRSDASPSPSTPKKARAATNAPPQLQASWLVQLFIEHPDLATAIADFLDVESALGGIGAAARALRVAVKAAMPRLGITEGDYEWSKPKLEEFGRLLHLAMDVDSDCTDSAGWVEVLSTHGLSARLHTLRGVDHSVVTTCEKGWAHLRSLDVREFDGFLSLAAERYPNVVFPHLHSLALSGLTGAAARDLLAALDRGAFPSLTALLPSRDMWMHTQTVRIALDTEDDLGSTCALLRRLPDTTALELGGDWPEGEPEHMSWAPFVSLVTEGGLANLKCVSSGSPLARHFQPA